MKLPRLDDNFGWDGHMGLTAPAMIDTGFENRYMAHLKEGVHESLDFLGRDYYGAICAVRERLGEWKDQNSVSRGLSPATKLAKNIVPMPTDESTRLPRFTHCLYVDQGCLDTLTAHANPKATGRSPRSPLVAVIDSDYPNRQP
ncbi:hypothetical protein NUW58_g7080 [Xylaria curta]|uniref:Uncharacterized protein n=1 Tax=Xylaria curta TaxID=42375 RepID=A0ACC1NNC7_9PEZI|nr:hypothetical protein NUW58_g7080 [Xylaria curta]